MNKDEHVKYWLKLSADDLEVVQDLIEKNRFLYALFFIHLLTEKLSKAIWIRNLESNFPPRTHNILKILKEADIDLREADEIFITELNKFQIEGRYPDYIGDITRSINKEFTNNYFSLAKNLRLWLLNLMQ